MPQQQQPVVNVNMHHPNACIGSQVIVIMTVQTVAITAAVVASKHNDTACCHHSYRAHPASPSHGAPVSALQSVQYALKMWYHAAVTQISRKLRTFGVWRT